MSHPMLTKFNISEGPKFKHNCEDCRFLGRFNENDLYYCVGNRAVLARFGNNVGSYVYQYYDSRLVEARFRAREMGLL